MVGSNVRAVREALGLTQQKFAERIGMKQNSVALIESNKRNASHQALLSICREFNVNMLFLETGEGEMFTQRNATLLELLADEYNLSPECQEFVEVFLNLPPDVRNLLATAVSRAAKFYPRQTTQVEQPQQGKPDGELTKDEVLETIGMEFDDAQAAKKRAIESSVFTSTSGAQKKIFRKT